MLSHDVQARSYWFAKFAECFLASLAASNFILGFVTLAPRSVMTYFPLMTVSSMIAALLFSILFSLFWHRKEKAGSFDSGRRHAWFGALIRYWLAFSLALYGFAKLFDAQFASSFHRSNSVVSSLSGLELTWNYFAYSFQLSAIIGLLQIAGGTFLLFRRTTLLGIAILLPVMLNVVLINFFYQISPGAFINSVLYTLSLIYLLTLYRKPLVALFWNFKSTLPKIGNGALRTIARVFAIVVSGAFVVYATHKNESPAALIGKWEVEAMTRNGKPVPANDWLTDSTAWKVLYIEKRKEILCCPNPYVFDNKRSLWLEYAYDDLKKSLNLISYERDETKPDTIRVKISEDSGKSMIWNMVLYGDTIELQLKKANP